MQSKTARKKTPRKRKPKPVFTTKGKKTRAVVESNGCSLVIEGSRFQVGVILQRVLS